MGKLHQLGSALFGWLDWGDRIAAAEKRLHEAFRELERRDEKRREHEACALRREVQLRQRVEEIERHLFTMNSPSSDSQIQPGASGNPPSDTAHRGGL